LTILIKIKNEGLCESGVTFYSYSQTLHFRFHLIITASALLK